MSLLHWARLGTAHLYLRPLRWGAYFTVTASDPGGGQPKNRPIWKRIHIEH